MKMDARTDSSFFPSKNPLIPFNYHCNVKMPGRVKYGSSLPKRQDMNMGSLKLPEFMKPPPFVTGGFVGSKSIEHHNATMEYSIVEALLATPMFQSQLIGQLPHIFGKNLYIIGSEVCWVQPGRNPYASSNIATKPNLREPQMPSPEPKSYAEAVQSSGVKNHVAASTVSSEIKHNLCTVTTETTTSSDIKFVNESDKVALGDNPNGVERTISESSDQSWATVEAEDNTTPSNPWIRSIMGCDDEDSDSYLEEDDDSISEEDDDNPSYNEDVKSENGEVVDAAKWTGEVLSPISSPEPNLGNNYCPEEYDSDDSDGILIYCGHIEDDEDEYEAEKQQAALRIQEANERWERANEHSSDQVDFSNSKKQVHFAADDKLVRVRPMIAWSHAYRAARKGDWDVLARDSERFRARISAAARILDPILTDVHRQRVWERLHSTSDQQ